MPEFYNLESMEISLLQHDLLKQIQEKIKQMAMYIHEIHYINKQKIPQIEFQIQMFSSEFFDHLSKM